MELQNGANQYSLQNPGVEGFSLAETKMPIDFTPGGIKAVKSENRRNDSLYWIDPQKITVVPGVNLRSKGPKRDARVRKLADDMKLNGFRHDCPINCIVLDNGKGEDLIVPYNGETRLDAVRLAIAEGANIDQIPVLMAPKTMSLDDVIKAQIKCNDGEPFSMLDTAQGVKLMYERGFSIQDVAQEFSCTTQHVDNLLVLASAPKSIVNMIASDQVSPTYAVSMIRQHGPERAARELHAALMQAIDKGKTRIKPKDAPEAVFRSALKKSSSKLFERALRIQEDPAYGQLREETRVELDALLQELKAAQPASEDADA